MMNIERFRYFLEIAHSENLSDAARKCFISQPALSQQMNLLERELNIKLLDRTRRGTQITDAGMTLLPKVQQLLSCYDDILKTISLTQQTPERLTIVYSGPIAQELLLKAIPSFREQYPEIQTDIHGVQMTDVQELVRKLHPDIVLNMYGETHIKGSHHQIISKRQICVALSCSNPLCSSKQLSLTDLHGEKMILLRNDASNNGNSQLVEWLVSNGFDSRNIIYVDSIEDQLLMVNLNQGVTIFPYREFHSGVVQIPFVLDKPMYHCTEAITGNTSAPCRALINILKTVDPLSS